MQSVGEEKYESEFRLRSSWPDNACGGSEVESFCFDVLRQNFSGKIRKIHRSKISSSENSSSENSQTVLKRPLLLSPPQKLCTGHRLTLIKKSSLFKMIRNPSTPNEVFTPYINLTQFNVLPEIEPKPVVRVLEPLIICGPSGECLCLPF